MPMTGAFLLSNPRRKRRAASSVHGIIARLKNRHRPRRRSNRKHGRRRNLRPWIPTLRANRRRGARRTNRRHGRRRKNGIALRQNGLVVRANRGRGRRRSNRRGRRKNGIATRLNPGFGMITNLVKKVPLIGTTIAPYIAPALVGGVAITAVHFALAYGLPLIQAYAPAVITDTILPYVAPIGYTVGGVLVGAAIAKLPIPMMSANTRKMIAVAAVVGGAAVDAMRYLTSDSTPMAGLGDGGMWQVVPFAGISAGSRTYGDQDASAVSREYADTRPADALKAPDDLDSFEGESALMGAGAWQARFQAVRAPLRTGDDPFSRYAGRQGHRWGWAIALLQRPNEPVGTGFARFQSLVAMAPGQRRAFIRKLRGHAISLVEQPSELNGLMLTQ